MEHTRDSTMPPESSSGKHETSEVRIRGFILFVAGFIGTAIVLHLALWGVLILLVHMEPTVEVSPLAEQMHVSPSPQLQGSAMHPTLPAEDLAALNFREEGILASYEWVDRSRGEARIPIDRAMQLLLQKGLPTTQASHPSVTN